MSSSFATRRRPAVVGALAAIVVLAGGIAVWAQPGPVDTATRSSISAVSPGMTAVSPGEGGRTEAAAAVPGPPIVDETTTTAAPAATVPAPKPTTTTVGRSTPRATTPTTAPAAAPATTTTKPAPQVKSGQRVNPTSAQVQAAITALHQRIPLFEPNEAQLRAFADAACAQFDQGQTQAQVEETVRKAVTYIQGASLSSADAAFAVKTVVQLRCPGYL